MNKNWWKDLDLNDLSMEDCVDVMFKLDESISDMKAQITDAKGVAAQHGKYSDSEWYTAVNTALRSAQRTRQAVQDRRGEISREAKRLYQYRLERVFMDVARDALDKTTFCAIMNTALELSNKKLPI